MIAPNPEAPAAQPLNLGEFLQRNFGLTLGSYVDPDGVEHDASDWTVDAQVRDAQEPACQNQQ